MESRHLDVIEMDAASHNGVDDVRQINDAIRYAPVSRALQGLHPRRSAHALRRGLQRAAEDAGRAAAAREVRVRHDRDPQGADHGPVALPALRPAPRSMPACWCSICKASPPRRAITAEPEALALIARAAEGSVRDALSLLDQAIAHAAGPVRGEDVRQMLGLADRTRDHRSVRSVDARRSRRARSHELREQYDAGADPGDGACRSRRVHAFRHPREDRAGAGRRCLADRGERTRGRAFAEKLSMRVLARTWQMLLKGIEEVAAAGRPLAAAEMVLVRIAYAADLPTPDEVIRSLGDAARGNGSGAAAAAGIAAAPACRRARKRRAAQCAPHWRPRAALAAPAPLPRGEPTGAREATRRTRRPARLRSFEELIALAAREARHRHQERARTRRAAGALRGRPARDRRSSRARRRR